MEVGRVIAINGPVTIRNQNEGAVQIGCEEVTPSRHVGRGAPFAKIFDREGGPGGVGLIQEPAGLGNPVCAKLNIRVPLLERVERVTWYIVEVRRIRGGKRQLPGAHAIPSAPGCPSKISTSSTGLPPAGRGTRTRNDSGAGGQQTHSSR